MGENFDLYVESGPASECWPWTGGTDSDGYGIYWSKGLGRKVRAHRFVFWRAFGWWPAYVCHHCDNPPCCNPACLFAGTAKTNHDDMATKGRRAPLRNGAKLDEVRVQEIRSAYAAGEGSYRSLAVIHGVSSSLVDQIVHRRIWKDVSQSRSPERTT